MMKTLYILALVSVLLAPAHGADASLITFGFVPLVPETPLINLSQEATFTGLLQALIGISVGVAAVLAVVMVAIGGFQYMTTDSMFELGNARSRIKDAIVGLLIVLMAVLVLRTINPNLVNLDVFRNSPNTLAPAPTP